jgi:hypothetical protein
MTAGVLAGGGSVMYINSSSDCYVSTDVLTNPADPNVKVIRFARPTDVKDPSRPLDFRVNPEDNTFQYAQASGPTDKNICVSTLTKKCSDANYLRTLYPNAGICSQASTPVPAGKGKGTSK